MFDKKSYRYIYWLITGFVGKNIKLILLTSILTVITIIGLISLTPYFETVLLTKQEHIGSVGTYDFTNLPNEITSKVSNGLVYINEKGEIIPTLATGWEIIDNNKGYRFHLKDNYLWSDGKKFTAHDLHYEFKDVQVKVIDDLTIEFYLTKPLQIFPTYLRQPVLRYPLIGVAGLYRLDHFKVQYGRVTELSLAPNKQDLPYLKYDFYENETQMINAYKKGEISKFTTNKKNIADVFANWKNTQVDKSVDYSRLLTLFFNMSNPFFADKEVRQAIAESFDPDKIAELGELANGPIPPTSWAYNKNLGPVKYDVDSAEKIIRKSMPATSEAKLEFATYYDYLEPADEIVTKALNTLGLNPNVTLISSDKLPKFDLLLAFWKVPEDPDQYYFWHQTQLKGGNIGGYKNVKIDKLLEDGRSTITTRERRNIYENFQKVIVDDPPAVFLYYPYIYSIYRK